MPPLCLHLGVAMDAAGRLARPEVEDNLGSYLFGASLPDIYITITASRRETHFIDLGDEPLGSGAEEFFQTYPHLAQGSALAPPLRALVAGYLSHLVTDQVWIRDMYRPFFSSTSPMGGDPMANFLDRMLQFELDRRERERRPCMAQIRDELMRISLDTRIDFLEPGKLREWHEFVLTAAAREPSWGTFPNFTQRFLIPRGIVRPEQLEDVLASLPSHLERLLGYVPQERIDAFRGEAVDGSVAAAEEYLS
ncbi:MAG: hypothetical protein ACE5IA_09060 [Dehalococcoidia bacterium]